MFTSARAVLGAILLAAGAAGCDPGAPSEGEPLGEADEALCSGYVVANTMVRAGTIHFETPKYLIDTVEAWGPHTLLLAIDQNIGVELEVQHAPGVQITKEKLTKTLQQSIGFSLSRNFEVTASASTVVDEGWYKRLEAYPAFQAITWELWQDACGPFGAARLATGTVYRPKGVYFRSVILARGPEKEPERQTPTRGSITAISSPVGAEAVGIHEGDDERGE